jgi:glycogen debranching enzyme
VEDDGLMAHGPQLTWMDAMINDRFVTPREGKAVEIQALWYNALKIMEVLATHFDLEKEGKKYSGMAEKARESFVRKFWNPEAGCLFDVITKEEKDPSIRPNQIIAVALDFSMLEKSKGERVVETVQEKLWGTYGLRTLSKEDLRYVGRYLGDWNERNQAYHSGTVWPWLIGPFTRAFLKVKNYREQWRSFAFRSFLKPLFRQAPYWAGLGAIGEIFDGDPPHTSRGCIAQAWSVAEPLRVLVEDILFRRPLHEQQILTDVELIETK